MRYWLLLLVLIIAGCARIAPPLAEPGVLPAHSQVPVPSGIPADWAPPGTKIACPQMDSTVRMAVGHLLPPKVWVSNPAGGLGGSARSLPTNTTEIGVFVPNVTGYTSRPDALYFQGIAQCVGSQSQPKCIISYYQEDTVIVMNITLSPIEGTESKTVLRNNTVNVLSARITASNCWKAT